MRILLVVFLSVFSISINAQIDHYWTNQFGSKSTLLGGSVVGNVRDNSAIFYNPGGLAFIENSSISVDGDAAYVDIIKHKNGAGDDIKLQNVSFELLPSALSGTVKDKKRPWLTLNYAILNRNISRVSYSGKYSGIDDVMTSTEFPGNENFMGTYSFTNETREDWLILGRGYRVNKRLGLGVSTIISFLSQILSEKHNISAFVSDNDGGVNELAHNINETDLRSNDIGLTFKFGISYEFDKLKLGANITTPRATLYAFSLGYLNRNDQVSVYPYTETPKKKAVNLEKIPSQHKTPWSIDIGASYPIGKKGVAYCTVAYFSKINKYNQLRGELDLTEPEKLLQPDENSYSAVFKAHKSVINVAFGFEYLLNEHYSILAGIRTDFNYLDFEKLKGDYGYIPTFSNYNIYHLNGGIHYQNKKITMNLGLISGVGASSKNEQLVDLKNPKDDNLLVGEVKNNVSSSFLRLGVLFGITYSFLDGVKMKD